MNIKSFMCLMSSISNWKQMINKKELLFITKNIKGKYPEANLQLLFCHYCMTQDNFYCLWNTYLLDLLYLNVHQVFERFFLC